MAGSCCGHNPGSGLDPTPPAIPPAVSISSSAPFFPIPPHATCAPDLPYFPSCPCSSTVRLCFCSNLEHGAWPCSSIADSMHLLWGWAWGCVLCPRLQYGWSKGKWVEKRKGFWGRTKAIGGTEVGEDGGGRGQGSDRGEVQGWGWQAQISGRDRASCLPPSLPVPLLPPPPADSHLLLGVPTIAFPTAVREMNLR